MQIKEELLDIEGIKNSNKSLIDLFIRRTAVLTSTPESVVEKIIKHQWKKANEVLSAKSEISEVDFCNLGSFFLSPTKAKKRIFKHTKIQEALRNNSVENPKSRQTIQEKLDKYDEYILNIKTKAKLNTNEN
jgi:hypothetical protein